MGCGAETDQCTPGGALVRRCSGLRVTWVVGGEGEGGLKQLVVGVVACADMLFFPEFGGLQPVLGPLLLLTFSLVFLFFQQCLGG